MTNIIDRRRKRLAELKCPTHGQTMLRQDIEDPISKTPIFQFACNQRHCGIAGTSSSITGPIQLRDEFAALFDETIGQLPTQTYNQRRGIRAADVAALALTQIAFVHRVETGTDIGVDFICEMRVDDKPTGKMFNVQCKALPICFDSQDDHIDFEIKVSTARYWLEQASPTVLLVPDPDTGNIYWAAPVESLRARSDDWRLQETVTVNVRADTRFACFEAIPEMLVKTAGQGIKSAGSAFSERLHTVKQAVRVLKVKGVTRTAKQLAPLLIAKDSPMSEARGAVDSLLALQREFAVDLCKIISEFADILFKVAEDVYRRAHALSGRSEGWAADPDYVNARAIVERAWAFVAGHEKGNTPLDMGELLLILKEVEELHQTVLNAEQVNDELNLDRELLYDLHSSYLSGPL